MRACPCGAVRCYGGVLFCGPQVFQGGGAAQDEEEALQLIEFQAKVTARAPMHTC